MSDIPRRCDIKRQWLAERLIGLAVDAVEEMAAHPLLTDAVVLLGDAKDKVADYIELGARDPHDVSPDEVIAKYPDGRQVEAGASPPTSAERAVR